VRTVGRWRVIGIAVVGLLVGFAGMLSVQRAAHTAPTGPEFTLVNVEANGVKVWLPSVIVVHPGEKVTLKLQNKLDAPHGFAIDDYGVQVVLPASGTGEVTFTARQGKTSRFYCQLHPAHVGGQVIVLP
jgi:nitrosocyanin